jgi:hypothetical protein
MIDCEHNLTTAATVSMNVWIASHETETMEEGQSPPICEDTAGSSHVGTSRRATALKT